jgi:hypothetical protein
MMIKKVLLFATMLAAIACHAGHGGDANHVHTKMVCFNLGASFTSTTSDLYASNCLECTDG